jgi:hypothetical protein
MTLTRHKLDSFAQIVAVSVTCWVSPANAQDPQTPPSSAARTVPPDIIRLKNGGFVRGTIGELIPSESVSIVTTTGETKRYAMVDVGYAGPERDAPAIQGTETATTPSPSVVEPPKQPTVSATARPVTATSKEVTVTFSSTPDGATFYRKANATTTLIGPNTFERMNQSVICTAPCASKLPIGTHALSMSYRDSPPLAGESVRISENGANVHGTYISRANTRLAGLITLATGFVTGAAVSYIGFSRTRKECSTDFGCSEEPHPNFVLVAGGVGLAGLSGVIGIALVSRRDYVAFSAPESPSNGSSAAEAARRNAFNGSASALRIPSTADTPLVTVSGRF